MRSRYSIVAAAALLYLSGLYLWPVDMASADSMSGGGVSSSGSQPWIGGHNNMPRQTLSPVGTVFTPPTSFGNFWILNNVAGQSVACPPDIADGDSMIVHLQYGAGAPYSPAISFSSPCYGWTGGTQPSWSEVPTQSDSAFCQSMNPPDVTGASFVCAPQLNVKMPSGGAPTASLSASPSSITSGASSTLTWGSNAASCTSPGSLGNTAIPGSWPGAASGSVSTGALSANTTYSIQCGTATAAATVSVTAAGDPTVGLLPPARSAWANWQSAGLQSLGGIPTRTNVCNPGGLTPIGGGADDTASIQSAINSCATPCVTYASTNACVIQLNAGTFTLSSANAISINKGVVLRGQGPGVTTIDRTNGAIPGNFTGGLIANARLGGGYSGVGSPILLTSDATRGDTTIHVASTAGISAGSLVNLDELGFGQSMADCCFNSGAGQVWASSDYRYEWNAHNPAVAGNFDSACFDNSNFTNGGNCAAGGNHTDATGYSIRAGGVMEEYHLVSSVNAGAGTITFDSPVTVAYRVSPNGAAVEVFNPANIVQFAGIENLTMSRGGDGSIQFQGCVYCWAKNFESYHYYNPGIHFVQGAFRDQLDNYWAHNGAWPVNGGGGYSIGLTYGASEIYIVNGISMLANKVIVMRASGAGTVVAYNYMDDSYIKSNAGWVETGLNNSHLIGSHHALFEGNVSDNVDADFTHGATSYATYYRNWITGVRATFTGEYDGIVRNDSTGCCSPRRALASHPYTYRTSFIGNIAGLSGVTTTGTGWVYSDNGGSGGNSGTSSMLKLGWNDVNTAGTNKDDVANVPYPADPRTLCPGTPNCTGTWITANGCMSNSNDPCTTVVDGNYDYVQGIVTWHQTPVTLPNSYYLPNAGATPPSFWGGGGWPAFNPSGPVLNDNPAHQRWLACSPVSDNSSSASCLFFTGPPTIGGATLSNGNNFITPASAGTTIDTISATCSAGNCAGATFSLSTAGSCSSAANNGSFAISGSNLNIGGTTVNAGTYTIGILVTLAGATNSPLCVPFSLSGVPPTASMWDPTHQGANTTLSAGNTIVTRNTASLNAETFSTQKSSAASQKNWAEIKCIATGTNNGFGVMTSNTPNSYIGFDGASFGFYRTQALFQNGNAPPGSGWAGCVNGDTVGMLVDETASPPTIKVAVLHGGGWGAFSTSFSMGGGSIGQGTRLYIVGDPEDAGASDAICTHSSCAASPPGIPAGAVWFDGF